jgi:hypothetical protein
MNKVIEEVTRTFSEYARGTQTFENMSESDKEFWEGYLVNIKVVEDDSGIHWTEIDYLPANAASNRLTSSASS